jgi:uncharacterized membrane protein
MKSIMTFLFGAIILAFVTATAVDAWGSGRSSGGHSGGGGHRGGHGYGVSQSHSYIYHGGHSRSLS